MTLGNLIKKHRIAAGLTQVDLAEHVGAAQPTISNLESGRIPPSLALLSLLAIVLGITPQALGEAVLATWDARTGSRTTAART